MNIFFIMRRSRLILIVLAAFFFACGCAVDNYIAGNQFGAAYEAAVRDGKTTMVLEDGNRDTIRKHVVAHFRKAGYELEVYSSVDNDFIVLTKTIPVSREETSNRVIASTIMLKFAQIAKDKTRIHMVNASCGLAAVVVDKDIQQLAASI